MIEEKVVDAVPADKAGGEKWDTGRTLRGKIARLPHGIRDRLNRRLYDGQSATMILPWLNGLPAVRKVVDAQFKGVPISPRNLTEWRRIGYRRWLKEQEPYAKTEDRSRYGKKMTRITLGTARGTAAVIADRILERLQSDEKISTEELSKMLPRITDLVRAEQSDARVKHSKKLIQLQDERLTLHWDKHMRKDVSIVQLVLADAQLKAIQALPVDNREKIEMIGRRKWKDMWQARKILGAGDGHDGAENYLVKGQSHSSGPPSTVGKN